MNLATQLADLTVAVQRYDLAKQQELDAAQRKYESLSTKNTRQFASKKAADRARYQKAALHALNNSEVLNSVSIGKAMGCGRLTAYKRLCVLEAAGLVQRVGSGVKTKWRMK